MINLEKGIVVDLTTKIKAKPSQKQDEVKEKNTIVVFGEVNEDMVEKLSRSFIGESLFPVTLEDS